MRPLSGEEALKMAQKIWKMVTESNGFDRTLQKVKIISAGNGSCSAEFQVEEGLTNRWQTLHGGCTATLVDCISSVGIMTTGEHKTGVTVNLSINCVSAAKLGTMVQVDARTVKCGKTLAFLDVVLKEKESGKVIASGTHVKFIG